MRLGRGGRPDRRVLGRADQPQANPQGEVQQGDAGGMGSTTREGEAYLGFQHAVPSTWSGIWPKSALQQRGRPPSAFTATHVTKHLARAGSAPRPTWETAAGASPVTSAARLPTPPPTITYHTITRGHAATARVPAARPGGLGGATAAGGGMSAPSPPATPCFVCSPTFTRL